MSFDMTKSLWLVYVDGTVPPNCTFSQIWSCCDLEFWASIFSKSLQICPVLLWINPTSRYCSIPCLKGHHWLHNSPVKTFRTFSACSYNKFSFDVDCTQASWAPFLASIDLPSLLHTSPPILQTYKNHRPVRYPSCSKRTEWQTSHHDETAPHNMHYGGILQPFTGKSHWFIFRNKHFKKYFRISIFFCFWCNHYCFCPVATYTVANYFCCQAYSMHQTTTFGLYSFIHSQNILIAIKKNHCLYIFCGSKTSLLSILGHVVTLTIGIGAFNLKKNTGKSPRNYFWHWNRACNMHT